MTELGELNATDRVEHGYTYLYDELFSPLRYKSTRVLEIGYARGRGTRMLAEFFPRGTVHSFDIDPNLKHYSNLSRELQKRIKLYQGDQSDPDSIQRVLQQVYDGPRNPAKRGYRQFDIIIDDGSHQPEHQQISFKKLWPEVQPGGLYIIEDFHPYYKNGNHETVSWLFEMIHKLNCYGDKHAKPTLIDVDWIMFARNEAIIRKKLSDAL
jgi:SAM-dependent methyltransferase